MVAVVVVRAAESKMIGHYSKDEAAGAHQEDPWEAVEAEGRRWGSSPMAAAAAGAGADAEEEAVEGEVRHKATAGDASSGSLYAVEAQADECGSHQEEGQVINAVLGAPCQAWEKAAAVAEEEWDRPFRAVLAVAPLRATHVVKDHARKDECRLVQQGPRGCTLTRQSSYWTVLIHRIQDDVLRLMKHYQRMRA